MSEPVSSLSIATQDLPESADNEALERIEANRDLLERLAETDTAAALTARRLLDYADGEVSS